MDIAFVDRILTCADCHGDFIFTAGEQLFFVDKQFKNDPKRCKPCKSRRSGLVASAAGGGPAAAGLSRTETRTECSECKIETTVPFKPTQGRPVLCRQCFQTKARATIATVVPSALDVLHAGRFAGGDEPEMTQAETVSALTGASISAGGLRLSADAAVLAVASMSAASATSSVASAADLASISTQSSALPKHATPSFASSPETNDLVAAGLSSRK